MQEVPVLAAVELVARVEIQALQEIRRSLSTTTDQETNSYALLRAARVAAELTLRAVRPELALRHKEEELELSVFLRARRLNPPSLSLAAVEQVEQGLAARRQSALEQPEILEDCTAAKERAVPRTAVVQRLIPPTGVQVVEAVAAQTELLEMP